MPNITSNIIQVYSSDSEYREFLSFFNKGYEGGRDRIFSSSSRLTDEIDSGTDRYGGNLYFGTAWGYFEEQFDLSQMFPCAAFYYEGEPEDGGRRSEYYCGGYRTGPKEFIREQELQVLREARRTCFGTMGTEHKVVMTNGIPIIDDSGGYYPGIEIIPEAEAVVGISLGNVHTVSLKKDGTVSASGSNVNGQCNVSELPEKAVQISCGRYHTAILLKSGRVFIAGKLDNDPGYADRIIEKCGKRSLLFPYHAAVHTDYRQWPPVVKIKSIYDAVAGITSDGDLYIDGYCPYDIGTVKRLITEVSDPFIKTALPDMDAMASVTMTDPQLIDTALKEILALYDSVSAKEGIMDHLQRQEELWKWSIQIFASGYVAMKTVENYLASENGRTEIARVLKRSEWQTDSESDGAVLHGTSFCCTFDQNAFLTFCVAIKQVDPDIRIVAEASSATHIVSISSLSGQIGLNYSEEQK